MFWSWLPLAFLIAVVLGLLELSSAVKPRLCWRSLGWVTVRVGIDGCVAAFAYPVLSNVTHDLAAPAIAVTAGASAPLILRSQFMRLGDDQSIPFGPLFVYDKTRDFIDTKIRHASAAAQSAYIWNKAVPTIRQGMDFAELLQRTKSYLNLGDNEQELLNFLDDTAEEDSPNDAKLAAAIEILLERKHWAHVRALLRHAKKMSRPQTPFMRH